MRSLPIFFSSFILLLAACGSDAPQLSPAEQLDDLSVEYSCGWGFYRSNPDQTTGLFISANNGSPERVANLIEAGDWTVDVHIGTDLFANWCSDLVLDSDPEPHVDEFWTLINGNIEVTTPPADCGLAKAQLTNLVVQASDGTQVALDDMTVQNPGWGCFAG